MWLVWVILAIVLVIGNLMILLRTAKKPKVPPNIKPRPYEDDDDESGW